MYLIFPEQEWESLNPISFLDNIIKRLSGKGGGGGTTLIIKKLA